jgi:hypothetical protein
MAQAMEATNSLLATVEVFSVARLWMGKEHGT